MGRNHFWSAKNEPDLAAADYPLGGEWHLLGKLLDQATALASGWCTGRFTDRVD